MRWYSGTTASSGAVGASGSTLTGPGAETNRALKKAYVEQGKAHAALVMDGDEAIAWAEYGTPVELPTLHHRKEDDATKTADPDYRITCVFVDKRHRRQ